MSKKVIGAVIAVAVVIVAALVAVQLVGGSDAPSADKFQKTAPEIEALLKGIPQQGNVLGKPDAPVTIVEYIDYKCPFCAQASKGVVREVITKYVRTGTVRLELRPIRLGASGGSGGRLGPDSERGAFAGLAAANQDRMWQFTEILLANQGDETQEWITDGVVTAAAAAAGLDIPTFKKDFNGNAVVDRLFENESSAQADQYTGTPFFVVTGPGGTEKFSESEKLARFDAAIAKVQAKK